MDHGADKERADVNSPLKCCSLCTTLENESR